MKDYEGITKDCRRIRGKELYPVVIYDTLFSFSLFVVNKVSNNAV